MLNANFSKGSKQYFVGCEKYAQSAYSDRDPWNRRQAFVQRADSSVMRGTASLDRTVHVYVTCDLWTLRHVLANIALNLCDYQTYLLRIRQSQCLFCFNQLRRN